MTQKQTRTRNRILAVLACFAVLLVLEKTGRFDAVPRIAVFVLFLVPYLVIGYDVIRKALRNIAHGSVFDENFLMLVATAAAFAIGEYTEALAVMLFYQIGELFQSYAVGRSRRSIAEMMSIAPETAFVEREGAVEEVDPDEVEIGEILVIRAGEKIPVDGTVVEGSSYLDTSALTGEPVPRRVSEGDAVPSGCVNGSGVLRIRAEKRYEDSTVAKILELVESASEKKARLENCITRFARWYTPVVTIGAAALAVIPPLLLGGGFSDWIYRACTFLIVSCPCALVISVPLGFFGGIGAASKIGVLVKGSNYLEAVSRASAVAFDKTGTITKGEFRVSEVLPADDAGSGADEIREKQRELLELAALAESFSSHPVARPIREACPAEAGGRVSNAEEIPGHGVRAVVDGKTVLAGGARLMEREQIAYRSLEGRGTVVYVACDGRYLGAIRISDELKDGVGDALAGMKRAGVKKTVLLTGDRSGEALAVASSLPIDEVRPELLPSDKVREVERLLREAGRSEKVVYVGDGINDAPVLMRADAGIAMGALGSDAAIEAADIVLMDDDLKKIPALIRIAKKTMRIVRENIVFALAVKLCVLVLGALGLAGMWLAVFADVGVAVLAILNSMRALRAS